MSVTQKITPDGGGGTLLHMGPDQFRSASWMPPSYAILGTYDSGDPDYTVYGLEIDVDGVTVQIPWSQMEPGIESDIITTIQTSNVVFWGVAYFHFEGSDIWIDAVTTYGEIY